MNTASADNRSGDNTGQTALVPQEAEDPRQNLESLSTDAVRIELNPLAYTAHSQPSLQPGVVEHATFYSETAILEYPRVLANPRLYPNGAGTVTWPLQVTDQNGNPVPGVTVAFRVEAVQPTGAAWRTEDGVVARYGAGSQATVRQRIRNGQIRLIGTMRQSQVVTNASGIAEGVYQVSHIGGNDGAIGQEKIIASISGSNVELVVDIGYDWLVSIPTVANGLRVQGATGAHTHRDLAPQLKRLGEAIQSVGWPHPATVTAGTLRWGGLYPPHLSHQWGAELDFRPMTTNGLPGKYTDANYDRERTQILIRALRELGATTIYFNDPMVTGATPLAGHDDHLHASFAAEQFATVTAFEPKNGGLWQISAQ
jgi:hypothetical protein